MVGLRIVPTRHSGHRDHFTWRDEGSASRLEGQKTGVTVSAVVGEVLSCVPVLSCVSCVSVVMGLGSLWGLIPAPAMSVVSVVSPRRSD